MDKNSPITDPIADLHIDCNQSEIKKCFCLLEEGNKHIQPDQKEVVLVLGITGSGKTTLVQFLTANEENLYAVDAGTNIGEYTIADKGNKISGNATIVSKTIFPDLVVDSRTNTFYYDCPGFSDTRGTAIDVAGTYFVHKIIRSVDRVKILITVNYSSVRLGMDRKDFLQLMKHTLTLIKNLDKYKNSIALVVTKVENQYIKGTLVEDKNLIDYIVGFLKQFKSDVVNIKDSEFVKKVTILIDQITEQDRFGYRRIGIFRRPLDEGSLAVQKPLQECKNRIIKIVTKNLQYAEVDENDFGYTISEQSKNDIQAIVDNINHFIVRQVERISQEVKANYEVKETGVVEVEELSKTFETNLQQTQSFINQLGENLKVPEFVNQLLNFFGRMNISKSYWSLILEQQNYLEFLELVGENKVAASSLNWKPGFRLLTEYLDTSAKWYAFLNKLQTRLSSYDLQKNVTAYRYLLNQKIVDVNDERLKLFMETQPELDFKPIQSQQIELKKLDILNKVLDTTLQSNMTVTHQSDFYQVHGDYVLLSKAINSVQAINSVPKDKFLNIFAMNTIFIDCDVVRKSSRLHQLSIIAPTWEIIGDRKIALNGQDARGFQFRAGDGPSDGVRGETEVPGLPDTPGEQLYRLYQFLTKGPSDGVRGEIGLPGLPGTSGGNFFGIGTNFINSHKLSISANGGKGGQGQDGGDGAAGHNGEPTLIETPDGCHMADNTLLARTRHLDGVIFRDYCILGQPGSNGGRGGDGGAGGEGGYPGNVKIITLKQPSNIIVSRKNGDRGTPGKGGDGGAGGKPAKSWVHESILFWWRGVDCYNVKRRLAEYPSCPEEDQYREGNTGTNGVSGGNTKGMQYPQDTDSQNPSSVINKYKELFREALARTTVNKNKGVEFLEDLNESESTAQFYDLSEIIKEFVDLENDYSKFNSEPNYPTLYQQLLNRVEKQLVMAKNNGTSDNVHVRTLQKLRTAILSKIFLLQDEPETKFIINMQEYLDRVSSEIENADLTLALRQRCPSQLSGITDAITYVRVFFQDDILRQTEELSKKLKEEIITLATKLDTIEKEAAKKQNQGILQDVKDLGKEAFFKVASKIPFLSSKREPTTETKQEWKQLNNRLAQLQVVEALQDIGQFLNFANGFADEVAKTQIRVHKEPIFKNLQQILDRNLAVMNRTEVEAGILASKIDKLNIVNNNSTDSLVQHMDKLKELRNHLENAPVEQLHRTKSELEIALKEILTSLTKEKYHDKTLENLQSLNDILVSIRVYDAGFENVTSIGQGVMTILGFALLDPQVSQLLFYVQEILDVAMSTIASVTDNRSVSTVIDAQIKIRSAVDSFKPWISKMKEEIQLPEKISTIFDKVDESTKMVLVTFDHLKHWEELSRLVDSMKEEETSTMKISDNNLKIQVDTLNSIIQYNLLLNQYKNTRKIVDRFVFPFGKAHESVFGLNDDEFKDLKKAIKQKIQAISSIVEKYRTSLDAKYEEYRRESDFNNDNSTAFYKWSGKEYSDTIADLLRGKRVVLKADIAKGIEKSAVTFDEIKINLKSFEEKLNEQLKYDLSNFEVSLTHFGNFYYRCKNEVYAFDMEKLNITYSFDGTGQPMQPNAIYQKIKEGDFLLSPYATWAIQLRGSDFRVLRKYENKVDLFLEGHAQFVQDPEACNGDLKSYYKLDSVIPEKAEPKTEPPAIDNLKSEANQTSSSTMWANAEETTDSIDDTTSSAKNNPEMTDDLGSKQLNVSETLATSLNPLRRKRNIRSDSPIQNQRESTKRIPDKEIAISGTANGSFKFFESDYFKSKAGYVAYSSNDNSTNDLTVNPQYNINDGLVLMDLVVRTVTKSKPNYFRDCRTNYENVRICSLNIIDKLQEILQSISTHADEFDFDAVPLMRKLEQEIINGNHKNIARILLQAVETGSTLKDEEQFYRRFKNALPRFG